MQQYLYFSHSFICFFFTTCFLIACLNPRKDSPDVLVDPEIFDISRAAKSRSSAVCAAQCKRERSVTRIPTHENLLTSVPTQNVDSAELTDIKRILNVLLKKNDV